MRRLNSIVLILILVLASSFSPNRKQEYRLRTVVIDAGHGGHDSGCLGGSAKEKHVALSVALKLGKMIEDNFPDVKVIYTRKTDVFIPLHQRAEIANKNKADLFICIHCNSGGKGAYGVETYVMGLHKTEENLTVARRENASVLLEEDYKKQYEGFDPNSPEANIIFNLYQNQFLNQSLEFASNIQNQVVDYAGRHNRGVRQAGFLVLFKTAMPSVLVETGFLTHDEEEKYLLSEKGQTNMATSIYRAFREYKIDTETPSGNYAKSDAKETPSHKENKVKESNGNSVIETSTEEQEEDDDSSAAVVAPDKTNNRVSPGVPSSVGPEKNNETAVNETKQPVVPVKPAIAKTQKVIAPAPTKNPDIFITVQIGATTDLSKKSPKIDKVPGVITKKAEDGYIRFIVGQFNSVEDAHKKQVQLKSMGFNDCFLSAYNGDKKINVPEALKLIKKK